MCCHVSSNAKNIKQSRLSRRSRMIYIVYVIHRNIIIAFPRTLSVMPERAQFTHEDIENRTSYVIVLSGPAVIPSALILNFLLTECEVFTGKY